MVKYMRYLALIISIFCAILLFSFGCGSNSSPDDPSSDECAGQSTIPANITATPLDTRNMLTWDSVCGADTYNLYWSGTEGVTPENGAKTEDVTSPYIHDSLTNDETYYYVVTAVGEAGESEPSDEVSAMPGIGLDTTFNLTGYTVYDSGGNDIARNVATVTVDGVEKIVVAGETYSGSTGYMTIWMYDSDGEPEAAFGSAGIVTYSSEESYGYGLAIDSQDRIFVSGWVDSAGPTVCSHLTIWCYDTSGTLCTDFGSAGVVTESQNCPLASAMTIAADPSGQESIYVSGLGNDSTLILKYDMSGNKDESYFVSYEYPPEVNYYPTGIVVDSSQRAWVAGSANTDTFLMRGTAAGALDTGIGTGGIITYESGGGSGTPRGLAISGNILTTAADSSHALVLAYDSEGELDNSFGSGGVSVIGSCDCEISLAFDFSGRIYVTGQGQEISSDPTTLCMSLERLNADGSVDTSFDEIFEREAGGHAVTVTGLDLANAGKAITMDSIGRPIVAGRTCSAGTDTCENVDMVIWRFR